MSINRRKFLSIAGTAAAITANPFESLFATKPAFKLPAGFSLKIMGTNWGFNGSVDAFCAKAKEAGYDGIEMWWPSDNKSQTELFDALKKHQLDIGFLCGVGETDPIKHLAAFKQSIDAAAKQNIQRPLYINCHSGKDYFPVDTNSQIIQHTIDLAKETGLTICHESHRSRILFAAHIAKQYINKFPDLRMTLDISHWCNVHESLLHDQEDTVQLALARTDHIHARVGHPEGPQVNDPRAPEWEEAVKRHLGWWDKIVELKTKSGAKQITILTEFGPPDYMPTLPFTRQPVADQWGINVHMMQLLRNRYKA
ncbi:MAG: sugar phosphate isomerase/epimerase [Chitinophagaceae bacterium]|nr:sugar phosphate isomerase/epimerase [Chitinophagaceae bacterium]